MKQKKAAKPANTKKNNRFFSRMFPRGHNQKKKKREIPSTQKSLPYKAMYRDGICHGKDALHGQVVKIAANSTDYINPLDINMNYSEDDSPLHLKSEFILSLFELIMGKNGIEGEERSIIDQAIRAVTNSSEGEGLLFYGNVIIPFRDHFPHNNLYRIMSTKLTENV